MYLQTSTTNKVQVSLPALTLIYENGRGENLLLAAVISSWKVVHGAWKL